MLDKIKFFFDGKKTVLGSILLMLAGTLDENSILYNLIYITGSLVAGTGIIHKRKKREI